MISKAMWFGIALIIFGVCFGFYVGIWVCFIGGIVDVITQIKTEELSALIIAWGIAKAFFAGFFGFISGAIFVFPGMIIFGAETGSDPFK